MGKILAYLFIIWLSIKWIFKTNVGDKVIYQNKIYLIANGVNSYKWRLHKLDNNYDGWVYRKDCKKLKTILNFLGSFKNGYKFYMGYWYHIWIEIGVESWMKNLNIW